MQALAYGVFAQCNRWYIMRADRQNRAVGGLVVGRMDEMAMCCDVVWWNMLSDNGQKWLKIHKNSL